MLRAAIALSPMTGTLSLLVARSLVEIKLESLQNMMKQKNTVNVILKLTIGHFLTLPAIETALLSRMPTLKMDQLQMLAPVLPGMNGTLLTKIVC